MPRSADGGIIAIWAIRKTATKLIIPIHDDLQHLLAMAIKIDPTILMTAYGQAFSLKGFGNMISTAIRETGLPGRCKACKEISECLGFASPLNAIEREEREAAEVISKRSSALSVIGLR